MNGTDVRNIREKQRLVFPEVGERSMAESWGGRGRRRGIFGKIVEMVTKMQGKQNEECSGNRLSGCRLEERVERCHFYKLPLPSANGAACLLSG